MPTVNPEVKYGRDTAIENAPTLTEEEVNDLKRRLAALDKILETTKVAKYKIEVWFGHERGGNGAYPGLVSLYESGNQLHGGGDTKVYECPATDKGLPACAGLIGGSAQGYGHLVCPLCQHVWKGKDVSGERGARLTTQNWAALIYKYYLRAGHNADIYMKYAPRNLRQAAEIEQQSQRMGEKLNTVRSTRRVASYPLKNIIKDVSAGADIVKRFQAFLSV